MKVPTHIYARMPDGTIYHGFLIERFGKMVRINLFEAEAPGGYGMKAVTPRTVTVMARSVIREEKN